MTSHSRVKGERRWPLGSTADIAWIEGALDFLRPVVTEVPPVFAAYCRLDLPDCGAAGQAVHDNAIVGLLGNVSGERPWWLGYLEYGIGITQVFGEMPRTQLFGWDFLLMLADAEHALNWRLAYAPDPAWKGALPDLMFHADHSWMLFTSWNDRWSGIGGSEELVQRIMSDAELGPRTQRLPGPYR